MDLLLCAQRTFLSYQKWTIDNKILLPQNNKTIFVVYSQADKARSKLPE